MISISEWYHTGDEEWDDFVDENIDIFENAIKLLGIIAFRNRFHHYVGVSFSWTVLRLMAAKWGANVAGFYLSGLLDGRRGLSNWNQFQQDVYDWGFVGEFLTVPGTDFGIGDILPNPFALADKFVESVVMINDFQLKRDKLSLSIIDSQLETGIEHVYYDIWKPLVSPQYDFTYGV